MTQQTIAAEEPGHRRSIGTFVKNNIREYGMLLSLILIMAFFQFMTNGTLLKAALPPDAEPKAALGDSFAAADAFLSTISWDATFSRMKQQLARAIEENEGKEREACSII